MIPAKKTLEPQEFNGVTPAALVQAMKEAGQGCHEAFKVIFNAFYEPMVWYFIGVKKVTDHQIAKDLTNEVLAKVWEKAKQYDSARAHTTTWVYCMADTHFIDYVRREQSKRNYFAMYALINTDYQMLPSEYHVSELSDNPEQIMIQNETSGYIDELFTEKVIGNKLLKLMELRYVKELSLKEIAKKLKMNDSTVRVNLRRGRQKIQDFISSNYELASQFSLISKFA
jgi:RNA polymerase sigma-70 factor (ECF subfamily)